MILRVEISRESENDLEKIFDYTLGMHGIDQAYKYVASFDEVLENLAIHPLIGRERNEIHQGLRSIIKDFHVIFYRIMDDRIRIVRILHTAQDLPKRFVWHGN
jgi:toxin ParE1/3/4